MTFETLSEGRYRVFLEGAPHPILAEMAICTSPSCQCRNVSITCREDSSEEAAAFRLNTDVDAWELGTVSPDRPEVRLLAAQILAAIPRDVRSRTLVDFELKYKDKRLQEYRIPPEDARSGRMVAYLDIVFGTENAMAERGVHYGNFDVDGKSYLTNVEYCPNPACDCRSVRAVFYEMEQSAEEDTRRLIWRLVIDWHFDGRIEEKKRDQISPGTANRLIAAWQERHGKDIAGFEEEYEQVKAVGRRSLESRPRAKVGRNQPCPCGSGKKYKRCCGA